MTKIVIYPENCWRKMQKNKQNSDQIGIRRTLEALNGQIAAWPSAELSQINQLGCASTGAPLPCFILQNDIHTPALAFGFNT